MYIITCKLCESKKETRRKHQKFCSRKCSGIASQKKRIYNLSSVDRKRNRRVSTHDLPITGNRYRPTKYPQSEIELYECIDNGDIPSRPAMVKIIKASQKFKEFIAK